ncbi:thiol:disulfide interchange protein DsbA/DsbL [Chitinimonas sp. BJYL2]|uniref:thiol:disulfide interchange protein DsbA/DsbL n=1 Tax=Chitinimonas sp. BJYL2 TaxID=2976696 RepID=UPI0022B2EC68|nr:thiol:disulfide interchange protein DsbA/DsbL [Chitinimonas sp. BJYL2]
MNSKRHFVRTALALGLTLTGLNLMAAGNHGEPYSRLASPQATATPGKIEVIEFFWYGCGHCNQLEPYVEAWEKTLPADVVFRREHALWDGRSDMDGHAKLFATLRTMGIVGAHQRAAFDAIHGGRMELRDEKTLMTWVNARGINRAQFETNYRSFGMAAQLGKAKQLTKAYRIDSVPTFIVNGKYVTSAHQAGNEQKLFATINQLIAQERKTLKR